MARSRAGTRDESKVTRSNSLHIMSIPARSFGQLDSKTEYLSVARGAVLLYSGKTRPRAPISMVHGSCHHFSPCARMIVKFISGVIYGTVRNYLPCWANRGELVLASYVTSVTMPEIQPQSRVRRTPKCHEDTSTKKSPLCDFNFIAIFFRFEFKSKKISTPSLSQIKSNGTHDIKALHRLPCFWRCTQ